MATDTTSTLLNLIKPVAGTLAGIASFVPVVAPFAPLLVSLAEIAGNLVADRKADLDEAANKAHIAIEEWIAALGSLRAEVEADDAASVAEAVKGVPV